MMFAIFMLLYVIGQKMCREGKMAILADQKIYYPCLCVQMPVLNWDVNLVFGIWGVNPNLIKSSRESEYI